MEHFVSSLVILAASILEISCEKNKQTDKRRWKPYVPETAAGVGTTIVGLVSSSLVAD